jgi:hypothetical protein
MGRQSFTVAIRQVIRRWRDERGETSFLTTYCTGSSIDRILVLLSALNHVFKMSVDCGSKFQYSSTTYVFFSFSASSSIQRINRFTDLCCKIGTAQIEALKSVRNSICILQSSFYHHPSQKHTSISTFYSRLSPLPEPQDSPITLDRLDGVVSSLLEF